MSRTIAKPRRRDYRPGHTPASSIRSKVPSPTRVVPIVRIGKELPRHSAHRRGVGARDLVRLPGYSRDNEVDLRFAMTRYRAPRHRAVRPPFARRVSSASSLDHTPSLAKGRVRQRFPAFRARPGHRRGPQVVDAVGAGRRARRHPQRCAERKGQARQVQQKIDRAPRPKLPTLQRPHSDRLGRGGRRAVWRGWHQGQALNAHHWLATKGTDASGL